VKFESVPRVNMRESLFHIVSFDSLAPNSRPRWENSMRITLWLMTRGIVLFVMGWCAVLAGSLVNAQDTTHEPRGSDPLREIKSPQNGSERQSPRFNGVSAESTQLPSFGHLPLLFEANNGQTDSRVQFLSRGEGMTMFFSPAEVTLVLPESSLQLSRTRTKSRGETKKEVFAHSVLRMRLVGGNLRAEAAGEEKQSGRSNYFIGNNPRHWLTAIPNYKKARYSNVYPGIDLIYYGNEGQLEHDFVVAAGADPRTITLEFQCACHLQIDGHGSLVLRTTGGVVRMLRPTVYQPGESGRTTVKGRYVSRGINRVGFTLASYDPARPLIIDPVLTYATYLGGSSRDEGVGIAVDSSGSVIAVGHTFSIDFPTLNAFQERIAGPQNVFLSKLDPTGQALVFSTYIGGNSFDVARGVALDPDGNAYITGIANSTNFPTTPGAFMTSCGSPIGCNSPFAAKFDSDGNLVYSTFTGPSGVPWGIAADSAGQAYITGWTSARDFPMVKAFQLVCPGLCNFVQKLNTEGSDLVFSTFLGVAPSSFTQPGGGIAVDPQQSAYVVGVTTSDFPLKNPIQPGPRSPQSGFLTKFTPEGNDLVYSTFLGGSAPTSALAVAVDQDGNAYVAGTTQSLDFPASPDGFLSICPFRTSPTSCDNPQLFVVKVDPTGNQFLYSSVLGNTTFGNVGLALDSEGTAWVVGGTASPSFPIVDPIQSTLQQGTPFSQDAFVAALGSQGCPIFSTYLGGSSTQEQGSGIALDGSGNVYVVGTIQGTDFRSDFPIVDPFQQEPHGVIIAKISRQEISGLSLAPRRSPFLTLRNVSSVPFNIASIHASENFDLQENCPSTLDGGGSCIITLQGKNDGQDSGTVTIASTAPGSPHTFTIAKARSGDFVGSHLIESPRSLRFPTQLVGTISDPQTITIQNIGTAWASVDNILTFGPFRQTNTCNSILEAGESCEIDVTYAPNGSGTSFGSVAIVHDGFQREDLFLGGAEIRNGLEVFPSTVDFGVQYGGLPPLVRTITLTNVSSAPLGVTGISATGEFRQMNNCTDMLAPHNTCHIGVSFAPIGNGNRAGALNVVHNGPGGAQTVTLAGTAKILSDLSVSPLELDLGPVLVGFTSNPQSVTLKNVSNAALNILSVSTSAAEFAQTNNCPASLALGASCTVNVTFTPSAPGDASGRLTVQHSGMGTPQVLSLAGKGQTALYFVPSQVDFGEQKVGTTSSQHFLSIGNQGVAPVTFTSFSASGDFQIVENPCPNPLPRFFGCALQIVFTPTDAGLRTGAVTIIASDSPQPHVIPLTGIGTP
jgi:Beta-propeller repeat